MTIITRIVDEGEKESEIEVRVNYTVLRDGSFDTRIRVYGCCNELICTRDAQANSVTDNSVSKTTHSKSLLDWRRILCSA